MGRAYVRWSGAECADTVTERRAEARSGERWGCGWGVPAQPRLDRRVAIGRGRRGVPADGREDRCRTGGDRDQCRGTALASAYAVAGRCGIGRLIAVSVRGLRPVVTVPGLGQPGRVHRAGMRHRQPRPPQAWSGQQERESQDAAPPDDADHAAKLASAPLLRKRERLQAPHVGARKEVVRQAVEWQQSGRGTATGRPHELAAAAIERLGRDFRSLDRRSASNQHVCLRRSDQLSAIIVSS
jgi:hypothetical protein